MDQFCYRCNNEVEVQNSEGAVLGKRKCGNKFSSSIEISNCPKCGGDDITLIPEVFLKLWDSDESVRYYVTETMEVRTGLTPEETHIGRQIINKYCGISAGQPEYCI